MAHAFGDGQRILFVCAGQNHHKLLSAIAQENIALANALANLVCDVAQHAIAHDVAVGVVHLLEMVDIEHQQREGSPAAHRAGIFFVQAYHAESAVENARKRVERGEFLQLLVLQRVVQRDGEALRKDRKLAHHLRLKRLGFCKQNHGDGHALEFHGLNDHLLGVKLRQRAFDDDLVGVRNGDVLALGKRA